MKSYYNKIIGANKNVEDLNDSIEYHIDEDEMKFRTFDTHKNSFRAKTKTQERRFSRIKKGKEKRVAQSGGVEVHCGIVIE